MHHVEFNCITFKIFHGDILEGVVYEIKKHCVFFRCGSIYKVYFSRKKMEDYKYVPGENPIFMNEKMSRIEKDIVVRFIVVGATYVEAEKEFQAVGSLESACHGHISQMLFAVIYSPSLAHFRHVKLNSVAISVFSKIKCVFFVVVADPLFSVFGSSGDVLRSCIYLLR
ncbi:hypothetical protein EJD97_014693 [Solanum chilense]|uniref:DNA-directed RNA polymerase subunit n=1 Tax=Solanum chilense TaxID=4083 RepID=A0A6N2ALM6_SOLCI|nr:hypothetical protein EJD97_014693 [Solanum chilense]